MAKLGGGEFYYNPMPTKLVLADCTNCKCSNQIALNDDRMYDENKEDGYIMKCRFCGEHFQTGIKERETKSQPGTKHIQ